MAPPSDLLIGVRPTYLGTNLILIWVCLDLFGTNCSKVQDSDRLVRQSGKEMALIFDKWQIEWNALLTQEMGLDGGSADDPAAKAIGFQKRRLADEYLLRACYSGLPA